MCCGSRDDYHSITPDRQEKPRPHHQYVPENRPRRPQPPPNSKPQYPSASRSEREKRERQAQATAAARNYGWPAPRAASGGMATGSNRSRDSMIEPGLASGLAAMPGSEFRAVYDPHKRRQLPPRPQHSQQQQQPQTVHSSTPPPPYQRPPYYHLGVVNHQPGRTQPMQVKPVQAVPIPAGKGKPRHHPAIARQPVIQAAHRMSRMPQAAVLVRRRDSNGVSECSDDEGDGHRAHEKLRNYTVSPLNISDHSGPTTTYPSRGGSSWT
ncbi:hypothetical protein GGR50DRAFT_395988 [Xylaria sp. CBS 124048]|nr:hypothetical protein GGR50DRAFT_395988 [Xylaria sp. CBS 124048]